MKHPALGTTPEARYMTLREAARVTTLSESLIRAAANATHPELLPLPHVRGPRNRILIRADVLTEWMEQFSC